MTLKFKTIATLIIIANSSFSQQIIGDFNTNDQDEWPKAVWLRNTSDGWDEGLIKHSSSKGVFGRTGFGIHMHESRDFGFYSTNWQTLLGIEGGTGDTYIKGNLGIGTTPTSSALNVQGGTGLRYSPTQSLKSNSNKYAWSLIELYGGSFDVQQDYMIGRGMYNFNEGRSLTFHIPSRNHFYNNEGSFPQVAFVSSGSNLLGYVESETGNWYMKGNVGVGTKSTGEHKLAVAGSIGAREIKVEVYPNWPDFVFEDDYNLPTLNYIENYIQKNGHLEDIPNAENVKENGFFVGEMNSKLLQKIEELTLYVIQQEKKIKKQSKKIDDLESINNKLFDLQKRLSRLENK